MRDISPEEAESAEAVRAAFVQTCSLFDYKLMEPSTLELVETLEAKSGPAVRDEIYLLTEKGEAGKTLGLRFDLTVGITRFVAARRDLAPPVRLGSFASMWRYDNPQYGRYRWFYQWDAELFGPSNAEADAEIIEFSYRLFRKIGTQPEIRINSRKIVEEFICTRLGITDKNRILDIMRVIDKVPKRGFDSVMQEYAGSVASVDQFEKLRKYVELSRESDSPLEEMSGRFSVDTGPLTKIVDSLKNRGIGSFKIDSGIVRGIDYYTDMVFEAYDKENSNLGSLCGGGRYDSLPEIYGRAGLGATGVAGGVERAILAHKIATKGQPLIRVFVAPVGKSEAANRAAEEIASLLRESDIPAQSEISGRSLRKILEAQSAAGVEAVIIIGDQELASKTVKIKWMRSGEEEKVSPQELARRLLGNTRE